MKQIGFYKYKMLSEFYVAHNRIYEVLTIDNEAIYFDDYGEVRMSSLSDFELSTSEEYEKQKIEELINGIKIKVENRSDIVRDYHIIKNNYDYHLKTHIGGMSNYD